MEVVARTDEYTIYKKRNQRYAIRNRQRQWVRGDDKVTILLSHKLIEAPTPKTPEAAEPEAAAAEEGEAQQAETAEAEAAAESPEEGEEAAS